MIFNQILIINPTRWEGPNPTLVENPNIIHIYELHHSPHPIPKIFATTALHLTSIAGVIVIQFLQCFWTFMIFYLYLNNFQFSLKSFASPLWFSLFRKKSE